MLARPMLAATYNDEVKLTFPLLATPKIDGVRALIVDGILVSRSFKPIPNTAVRQSLEALLPEGADGEITCGDLYETTSVVMSKYTRATKLKFSWFDWFSDSPYCNRVSSIAKYVYTHCSPGSHPNVSVISLYPSNISSMADLEQYETQMLHQGYEGIVVRDPKGKYKFGRSTIREGLMIKIKRYADCEATIVGTEELMHNTNERHKDNFGNAMRSSTKAHLTAGDTLGAIIASTGSEPFKIGTGFTVDQRDALWANRDTIRGQLVKYKCDKAYKNRPRCPVFLGIRHADDLCSAN